MTVLKIRRWIPLIVAVVLAAGMWGYLWEYVHGPLTPEGWAKFSARISGGNHSDLYPFWLGARELLLRGRDPYSPEITVEIQQGFFGYALDPNNPADTRNEERFIYPVYVVLLLAPTVFFSFRLVQFFYVPILVILSAASVILWARALGVRMRREALAAGVILMLGSWPVMQGIYWQQLSLLVASMIACAAVAVAAGALGTAGVLLAFAMIKPNVTFPVAGWLLLWAGGNWRERKALPFSFAIVMAILLVSAELLLPGWFWRWVDNVSAWSRFASATTWVHFLFGRYMGGFLWVVVLVTLIVFGWQKRRDPASSDGYKLALASVICGGLVLVPRPLYLFYDQVALVPLLMLGVLWRNKCMELGVVRRMGVAICLFLLAWPWVVALAVSLTALCSPAIAQKAVFAPWLLLGLIPISVLIGIHLLGGQGIRMKRLADTERV